MTDLQPIRVHPDSPHYLEFRGEPVILVTSAEHYGAVINREFDLVDYLDALAAFDLNYTRIYPGAYFETTDYFAPNDSLSPRSGQHILPWARSSEGEYVLGGTLFDLDTWDEEYFQRLRTFARLASERGIVVEVCFFNCMYREMWRFMPMNAANNIQKVGSCEFFKVQSVDNGGLLAYQIKYVQKLVRELNEFDNIIFEIVDEPGNYGVPATEYGPWVGRMLDAVRGAEADLPNRHLIAQQIIDTLGGAGDFALDPRIDIATGQYVDHVGGGQQGGMRLLDSIYYRGKPIELNESTYFPGNYNQQGEDAEPGPDPIAGYRAEAWEFIVGGGAAYNHLNALYKPGNSGAKDTENEELLTGLRSLRHFMARFEFWKMEPVYILSGERTNLFIRGIGQAGLQYAAYLHHSSLVSNERYRALPGEYQDTLDIAVPQGRYTAEWIDPQTLNVIGESLVDHEGRALRLTTPTYRTDIALRLVRA